MKQRFILLGIAVLIIIGLVAFDRSHNPTDPDENATTTVSTTTLATTTEPAAATPAAAEPAPVAPPVTTPKPAPETEPVQPLAFSRADVATHGSSTSCWTIIGDSIYDLTDWIDRHPGGERAILSICGTDGTEAFDQQHGSSNKAKKELAEFFLAPLAD